MSCWLPTFVLRTALPPPDHKDACTSRPRRLPGVSEPHTNDNNPTMNDVNVLSAIEQLTHVASRQQLAEWAGIHLLDNSGASSVLIGFGRMQPEFFLTPFFMSSSFPVALVKTFDPGDCYLSVPLLHESRAARSPVLRELCQEGSDALWQALFRQKGFMRVAVVANSETHDGSTTYLCMTDSGSARDPQEGERLRRTLSIVAPVLHGVLSRLAFEENRQGREDPADVLTAREREILGWIRMGKTNSEISCILGVAVSTIKNHVQRILIKLRVNNRTQAIAKCLH